MRRYYFFAVLLLVLIYPSAKVSGAEARIVQVNKIAAVVNGEIITLHDLRQNAAPQFMQARINPSDPAVRTQAEKIMREVLSFMVDEILLRQEGERLTVTVAESEVENELNKIVQRNQTNLQEFERRLASQGNTLAMFKSRLRNSILSQRMISFMIARKIVVTNEEISKYYAENAGNFSAERSVDVSLIVFPQTIDVSPIYNRLQRGALSFENAAKQYSIGPSPDKGGSLGVIAWADLANPLRDHMTSLQPGQISAPFIVNSQTMIMKLNAITNGRQMTLEEASPEIERILREPRMQERFTEYTQQLRSKAVIDIRL